jgi:hypothetical protein
VRPLNYWGKPKENYEANNRDYASSQDRKEASQKKSIRPSNVITPIKPVINPEKMLQQMH